MEKICLNCGDKFTPTRQTAKYCSNACKLAFNRNNDTLSKAPDTLTDVDRAFETSQPDYYKFTDVVYERTCIHSGCDKKFKTRLQLLRFCSPDHMLEALGG